MQSSRPDNRIDDLKSYQVGGAVRDHYLKVESSDKDWVVVGATPQLMESLGFKPVGKSFPVFLHPDTREEWALARTEKKSGKGYTGFIVDASAEITLEQDLFRRDLTINSMAMSRQGELVDPFGGLRDLENGVLRHVSEHFAEDPLRVLRVSRFAARYHHRGFIVHESTLKFMRDMSESGELVHLTPERVWQEFNRALGERNPSVFFKTLHYCKALKVLFPVMTVFFRKSDCSSTALERLDFAGEFTNSVLSRFAVLIYFIANEIEGHSREVDLSESISNKCSLIEEFCDQLKTPSQYKWLAMKTVTFADRIRSPERLSPQEIVSIIQNLNGIRNEKPYERFLKTCQVLFKVQIPSLESPELPIEFFRACRTQLLKVDAAKLSETYSGSELGRMVKQAQVNSMEQTLAAYKSDSTKFIS